MAARLAGRLHPPNSGTVHPAGKTTSRNDLPAPINRTGAGSSNCPALQSCVGMIVSTRTRPSMTPRGPFGT